MHSLRFCQVLLLMSLALLPACSSHDDPIIHPDQPTDADQAVCFSSSSEDEEEWVVRSRGESSRTRVPASAAAARSYAPLNHNFVVYGYKTYAPSAQFCVFSGYDVTYKPESAGTTEDNTHNYSYVDPSKEQFIKYWDYAAIEYRYWAYVPSDDKITAEAGSNTLTLTGMHLQIEEPTDYLVSRLKVVNKLQFGQVVQMQFVRPYARIKVQIYSGQQLEPAQGDKEGDVIELSHITFGPTDGTSSIATAATVSIQYPLTGADEETLTVTPTPAGATTAQLSYRGLGAEGLLTLTSDNCSSATAATIYPNEATDDTTPCYYVFPLSNGEPARDFALKVSVDGDEELKTAVVPAAYMHWQPNHSYTYLFKILEGGLIFVDAKADEWQSGGSGNDIWTNW